ncbi:hypothetical protein CHU95_16335 [Niveispirillum lacus]|uniref:DUF4013 domain-containing protein n=1 Tax=Niveispirillum lacus TaxID=1981099 RepID=A0A255YVC4_9PROT|nr:hypothetical protein [Niveispirillum lacus]OYQ32370.1 hypothetical protein CHU95_16335 [Niveispirillum lacus]
MNFRDAWRESLAIYLLLLSDPGRVLRFAGAPALILAALGIAQMTRSQDDGSGGSLLLLLSVICMIWSLGVWTVRWSRFLLLGEDGPQFWDMPFEGRNWRVGGILLSMMMLSAVASILPATVVMTLLASVTGHRLATNPSQGPADAAAMASAMPDWFFLTTYIVIILMTLWPVARLGPAIGSVVQDGKFVMGASWKATGHLGGLPPLLALILVNLLQVPAVFLWLTGLQSNSLVLLILANVVLSITHPLVTAMTALLWARIYGVAIGPYQSAITARDEE